jgi:Flp pilus assembly protein TadD
MISDPILQAFQLFQNGQYDEAGESCQLFLAGNPDHAEMNHLFGVIRFQQGRMAEALDLMKRAVSTPGASAEMHNNYGAALNKLGRNEEAVAAFNQALALKPDYADA